jgi:thiol-disulfide isomerase/thioredoxin
MRTIPVLLVAALVGACASDGSSRSGVVTSAATSAPLVVTDMEGRTHDLEGALRGGQVVALIFWQTWCASCIEEAPRLAADARAHGDEILFLGVVPGPDDYVDDGEVEKMAAELGLPYPQVRDRDLALSQRFEVKGTPTIVVLGSGGRILFRGHRSPQDWSALALSGSR